MADLNRWLVAPDDLPWCPACEGARYQWVPPQTGEITGHLEPCTACGENVLRHRRRKAYRKKQERIRRFMKFDGRFRRMTFATFDKNIDPLLLDAYHTARDYARDPRGWLVMVGSKGIGKTHLAAAIVNEQLCKPEEERPISLFFVAPDLLDMLRSGYREGDYDELLELCQTCDLLVIDDLGTEHGTPWAFEKLYQIINYRYNALLPLVVVSNQPLTHLTDSRLYDRLSEDGFSQRLHIYAPSYRQHRSNPGTIVD